MEMSIVIYQTAPVLVEFEGVGIFLLIMAVLSVESALIDPKGFYGGPFGYLIKKGFKRLYGN